MFLECRQQCHHLAEDLLVGLREIREPSLEQRVVSDLHGCILPHMLLTTSSAI
jgi:hypothetical protein